MYSDEGPSSTTNSYYHKIKSLFCGPRPDDTKKPIQPLQSGQIIQLDGFGGCFELTDGQTATLQNLVDISVGGVILFTYPKANTPDSSDTALNWRYFSSIQEGSRKATGTTQACLFRDSYQDLRDLGFAVYGLSRDSTKSNEAFKNRNDLPFPLICNTDGTLINALGFQKPPKGTVRGVIVIDKEGRVLASMVGSPDATVKAVWGICNTEDFPISSIYSVERDKIAQTTRAVERMGVRLDNKGRRLVAETVADVAGQVNAAEQLDRRSASA